ncbi:MAG: hypothetical protein IPJ38_23005 [Dechloromonas sp.]|uniref:Uncharacterized protein n=1 Tax=Candidatus Dechloromonas phosphorivorans TaxID=2899244 RepID=A0A935K8L8_9RHOO|nr:hypothetical protein [Candidatus Dechloromonas phosphorivorans]
MKTIQKWFEQLAGISQDELDRLALAAEVFPRHLSMPPTCKTRLLAP